MADALDTAIGRVLQKIDDEGMRDNTLVVFVSDNGGNETEGGASNYPLRGQKGQTWDGGIRVPAAMRWPGVLTPSTVSSQVVSIMDLFPTLTAALGVEPQNVRAFDGKNLWSNIRDGQVVDPEAIVIQKRDAIILDGQWKLVQLKATGEELLYDIRNDESETMDLSATYPAVVTDLSAKLQAMLDTAP
jgi:arylsulfatase A-like enzyme